MHGTLETPNKSLLLKPMKDKIELIYFQSIQTLYKAILKSVANFVLLMVLVLVKDNVLSIKNY